MSVADGIYQIIRHQHGIGATPLLVQAACHRHPQHHANNRPVQQQTHRDLSAECYQLCPRTRGSLAASWRDWCSWRRLSEHAVVFLPTWHVRWSLAALAQHAQYLDSPSTHPRTTMTHPRQQQMTALQGPSNKWPSGFIYSRPHNMALSQSPSCTTLSVVCRSSWLDICS